VAARVLAGSRVWHIAEPSGATVSALSSELGVSRLVATVLVNRGLDGAGEAAAFLDRRSVGSTDPFDLPGMDRAVTRLLQALRGREEICVYGDYDVDGLTATALLETVLRREGGHVRHYLPSRTGEGYGLNEAAIRTLAGAGVNLIVTVDCGITAPREAALARSLGLGFIITDHHEPGRDLPLAEAIVNPRLPESAYPFSALAGVGVAYKLAQALLTALNRHETHGSQPGFDDLDDLLDLVALGTVADVAALVGENRSLVHQGLNRFNPPRRPGLEALARVARLEAREITTYHLGFQFGPRLNAAGRLGDAERALLLLLTENKSEATELAAELDQSNRDRQALEERILEEATAQVERTIDLERERAIVLSAEGWHEGVIGIVATRLVERFARPTLLVAVNAGAGRGSGRSIPSFDLVGALDECAAWLGRYGGHRLAAGFEIDREALEAFARRFLEVARERLDGKDLVHELRIDACVEAKDLPASFFRELERLSPFGAGNPEPVLAMRRVGFSGVRTVGVGGRHLKALVRTEGRVFDSIGFGLGSMAGEVGRGGSYDIAFRPGLGEWNGVKREELRLADVRPAS